MLYSHPHRALKLSILAAGILTALPGFAQEATTPTPAKDLDTVTVSATRREEPLQKVPVAVSVVTGERMQAQGLNNIRDISAQVPALNFRSAASSKDQSIFLRGMGTVSTSPGVEPTVSTVIDGVPLARQGMANLDLLDVDHIEVLRGPQGTLFGKNASAGVVSIITKNPTAETTGSFDLSWYEGNEIHMKAGVSGALVPDKVNASVSVLSANYDGNVTNVYNGDKVNGYTKNGGRAKFEIIPGDNLRATVSLDYLRSHDTTAHGVVTQTWLRAYPSGTVTNYANFAAALAPVVAGKENRQANVNQDTYANDTNYGIAAQLDWHTGDYEWTSITAYRKWENLQLQDNDRLPKVTSTNPQRNDRGELDFNQISQELRVASPKGGFIDYVAGVFYMRGEDEETYTRETTQLSSGSTVVNRGVANFGTINTNYSVFGEMTLNFTDAFRGIAGARFIHDDIDYYFARTSTSATAVSGIQTAFANSGSTQKDGYSARLGLQYDLSDRANVYFTYSRGYKGPAYNLAFSMLPQDTQAAKPETSNAFELGLKSSWFNHRLDLNVALFQDDFDDYQVNFYDTYNGSIISRLINAGSVSTKGVELDLSARPADGLRIGTSVAYTRARIDKFVCPTGTTASCDVNGKTLPFAPDWKASVNGEYRVPVSENYDLSFVTDYSWQSESQYSINQTPDTIQPAYGIWNASVTLSNYNGWRISLLGKNLTDKSYAATLATFDGSLVRGVPRNDERYFGLAFHKDF
ncbi:TonB-dependent receptor [Xanthomonas theicola]|uniref:TonB-dependent receptor n=1 Tax=Xanthomonas theicola TaxID=56464 RepID=A0A2S6ZBQ8_9XANT|nr:TonB-dependent receptor [Xanthomonas theicola]PPT84522.1 TonB-dependent receptor [Xanthomonas theicola]QNH25396.1 TonB-dependent receptor [Xanthomonas theicola]